MNYHAALAHFPKITYSRYRKIIGHFFKLENLWQAELEEIIKSGLEENIANEFLLWKEQNSVEKITESLAKEKITTVSLAETDYPKLLKEINDPPHTLFVRGQLPKIDIPSLSVVGTRRFTSYGKQVCTELVQQLAQQGLIIVSGLALGIDGIAHEATLEVNGTTIAVLGSGVHRQYIYPSAHKYLAEKIIASGGAIISEYHPSFMPTQYSFPARNRIIAGFSLGTLVIEAPESSGSLITTKCALDYNREVLAVPHNINSLQGEGCNKLLKLGAKPVTCAEDVIEALNLKNLKQIIYNRSALPSTPQEEKILACLNKEPQHIDLIIKNTGLDSSTVNSTLILMEMKNMVKNRGNMSYTNNS